MARVLTILIAGGVLIASPAIAKPSRWCGWYARQLVANDPGEQYNLACNWLNYGHATSPHVGAMVVWCGRNHHHVGKIVGTDANGNFVITSGNDGHAVRTRARSVAGASFRE